MSKDELIRALASTRTDLNKAILVLKAAVGEVQEMGLKTSISSMPGLQESISELELSVIDLNISINALNNKD